MSIDIKGKRRLRRFGAIELWEESVAMPDGTGSILMHVYRTPSGAYVSAKPRADGRRPGMVRFISKHGIAPELRTGTSNTCSIGYSAKERRWYGWSHRAACGFRKGDRIFEERYGNDKTPFRKHGRRVVQTPADAKVAAQRFAASVS